MADALGFAPDAEIRCRDYRIGCIGAGFIMADCHLVAYRQAGFNPVAIASRDPGRAKAVAKQRGVPRAYETYQQLLDDPAVEVVDDESGEFLDRGTEREVAAEHREPKSADRDSSREFAHAEKVPIVTIAGQCG